MIPSMLVLAYVIYSCYIIVVFSYTANIMEVDRIKPRVFAALIVANSFLVFGPIYVTGFKEESLIMALYVAALTVETLLVCKMNLAKTLFGVFSFAINFFAIRTCIIVFMCLATGDTPAELIESEANRIIITSINLFIPIPYILFTRRVLRQSILSIALSDNKTTILSSVFLGGIFLNQMGVLPSLDRMGGDIERNLYYHLATAIFSVIIFIFVMAINYFYSNLKVVAENYSEKIEEIRMQDLQIRDIVEKSNKDSMTGFYLRHVAMEELEWYIKKKAECFIVFIDIDGLKKVNDNHGHNEGDCYISEVSERIRRTLDKYTIARIGGDEFLIVGETVEDENITDIMLNLEKEIGRIAILKETGYSTSISYGIELIKRDNVLPSKTLIDRVDKKMYNFKKSRNRNRE